MSICSGAFALAAAGLLDGREATTHWRYAGLLQRRFPQVKVDPDVLYVDGEDVLTSAGSAAGLDLLIHLVRKDYGPGVANEVARRLVIPPHREGGQAQFIQAAVTPVEDGAAVATAMAWALEHLAEPITIAALAEAAHMSRRTFIRHFGRQTGTSPLRWVISQRVTASLAMLESTSAPVEEIASAVGFDSAATFRHHFTRAMRTSPRPTGGPSAPRHHPTRRTRTGLSIGPGSWTRPRNLSAKQSHSLIYVLSHMVHLYD